MNKWKHVQIVTKEKWMKKNGVECVDLEEVGQVEGMIRLCNEMRKCMNNDLVKLLKMC
jgi:hypothetical protein